MPQLDENHCHLAVGQLGAGASFPAVTANLEVTSGTTMFSWGVESCNCVEG